MKKIIVLVSVLIILVILVVAVFVLRQTPQPQEEEQATQEPINPIEDEIPDVNPTANTNPFGDSYKNPFE